MKRHTKPDRKALGAYYTPINLSRILCEWAVRRPNDYVLEPSFGGCGFLEASIERLTKLGSINPVTQLYGADIDPTAFDFLTEKLGDVKNINQHFLYKDFIQVSTNEFYPIIFDAVIGNPPYVSLHNMSKEQKESCFELLKNSEFAKGTIGKNASLWAFFLLHSLSFIKCGGRSAWVLPSSLLHADYANAVLNVFRKHFSIIKVIKLNQRFFQSDDADEISVILFADDFSKTEHKLTDIGFCTAKGEKELQELCQDISLKKVGYNDYKSSIIKKKTLTEFNKLCNSSSTNTLGDFAKIVIGMVTGDNKKFIIDKKTVAYYKLDEKDLKPVVGRFSILNGLIHTKSRHKSAQNNDHKAFLVCPDDLALKDSAIRKYLSLVSKTSRKNNRTFAKRGKWYFPDDNRYPDAYLTYMIHKLPRMVINLSKINCTNSVHRVFFNKGVLIKKRKAIAISMLSSFSQLSAELEGRAYGSGVLKLEPSAAKKIQVLLTPELEAALYSQASILDKIISQGLIEKAQALVDDIIVKLLNIPPQTMLLFSSAVVQLREERYRGLNKVGIIRDEKNDN